VSSRRSGKKRADGRSAKGGSAFVYALAPGEATTLRYHVVFPRRGWEELSNIVLESRYPFGFFQRSLDLPMRRRLLVYPELCSLELDQWRAVGRSGLHGGQDRGEGSELHSLRDYTAHDSARRIVWKVSARVNRLIVAETLRDADPIYRIALNCRAPAGETAEELEATAERFERVLSFIASLGVAITPRGQRLVVYTPAGEVTVNERGDLERLLRALALLPFEVEAPDDRAGQGNAHRWAPPDALQLIYAGEQRITRNAVEFADWNRLMHPPPIGGRAENPGDDATVAAGGGDAASVGDEVSLSA
jgi:uncharacterized protein (DUF58 family)